MPHVNPYEREDRAALYRAMLDAYAQAAGINLDECHPPALLRILERLRALCEGRCEPETAADLAALALLEHDPAADEGDPITEADREALRELATVKTEED